MKYAVVCLINNIEAFVADFGHGPVITNARYDLPSHDDAVDLMVDIIAVTESLGKDGNKEFYIAEIEEE